MKNLYVYLHTHWDREWYEPFESFRAKLVQVVAKVVGDLKSGSLPVFYLDGQAAVLEDATQLAPQLIPELQELMRTGRLAAGPWYVLADEILVSGESLIRNLQMGIVVTSRFGPVARIGYSPDTFGHTQDLPRILSGFGIKTAVVWRGVPPYDSTPVFWWRSPDGSSVLTYQLSRGYYQTALHDGQSPEQLREFFLPWLGLASQPDGLAQTYCSWLEGALFPSGADHASPPADAQRAIDDLGEALKADKVEIKPLQLEKFLQIVWDKAARRKELATISGELRDNMAAKAHERAFLLPGVLSTRLYLKRQNRQSEFRLAAISEPLLTLLQVQGKLSYPAEELRHCWRLLILNHAHDSICGCSVDEVHDEMQTRSRQLNAMLDGLDDRIQTAVAAGKGNAHNISVADPAWLPNRLVVYNLSASQASAPVRLTVAVEPGAQIAGGDGVQILCRNTVDKLFTGQNFPAYYKLVELVDCLVWAANVPPFGVGEIAWPLETLKVSAHQGVTAAERRISNEDLVVEVNNDGELIVTQRASGAIHHLKHRLQDVGDAGDTYNFDPVEADPPSCAKVVSVLPGKEGPLQASLKVIYELEISEGLEELDAGPQAPGQLRKCRRSSRKIKHQITTEITVTRGSSLIRFETQWENKSRDHRLEVVFETGAPIQTSWSENHFSVVERKHPVASSPLPVPEACEAIVNRFPAQRFVIANNHVFLNCGLPEYAINGTEFSITILRAVSMLSHGRLRTRGGGAGPHLPVPGANCLGINRATYAWAPLPGRETSRAYALAEEFEDRLVAVPGRREEKEQAFSLLKLDNEATRPVALYFDTKSNEITLRILNVSLQNQKTGLSLEFPCREVYACRLDGTRESKLWSAKADASSLPNGELIPLQFSCNELKTIKIRT